LWNSIKTKEGVLVPYYAQIANGVCIGICELSDAVEANGYVPIDAYYLSLLGAYYDPENNSFEHLTATATKTEIIADGVDAVVISVHAPDVLDSVLFYAVDTGEIIATVPIDPETRTATLQVTATTPGIIRIRAGEPTITRLNEVIVHVVEAD